VTLFYLIRHGEHALQDRVMVGRAPGVWLSERGRAQAQRVADWLVDKGIEALLVSPSERAQETARPIVERLGIETSVAPELEEIDVGRWTGLSMAQLHDQPGWPLFNSFRSGTPAPEGEWMLDVQRRMVGLLEGLRRERPRGRIALVSHRDPIKTALLFYLGMPIDLFHRFEIDTGSITRLEIEDWGPRLLHLNEVPA
jgi:probable phosphoglycerate mutase